MSVDVIFSLRSPSRFSLHTAHQSICILYTYLIIKPKVEANSNTNLYGSVYWINRKTHPTPPASIQHVHCAMRWDEMVETCFCFHLFVCFSASSLNGWFLGDSDVYSRFGAGKKKQFTRIRILTVDNYKLGIKSERTTSAHKVLFETDNNTNTNKFVWVFIIIIIIFYSRLPLKWCSEQIMRFHHQNRLQHERILYVVFGCVRAHVFAIFICI